MLVSVRGGLFHSKQIVTLLQPDRTVVKLLFGALE